MEYIIDLLSEKKNELNEEIRRAEGILSKYGIWKKTEHFIGEINVAKDQCLQIDKAISLLHSENRKGVSDALQENGDLHAVRKWNAPSPSNEGDSASVAGALGKRIDTKEDSRCIECGASILFDTGDHICAGCWVKK